MKHTKFTIKPRILILSNGELAEPQYFQDFKDYIQANTVKIIRSKQFYGKAPFELINIVAEYKEKLENANKFIEKDGDQMWCVFDVDDFFADNSKDFKAAIALAHERGIHLAWSHECFELWFLCHFSSVSSAIPRVDYHKKLKKFFKEKGLGQYEKNMNHIFEKILKHQETAIKNAKKIFSKDKVEKNPSTAVFLLVEELLKI
jgi:hypothetical protein